MSPLLPRFKLDWSDALCATGPDGTQYALQNERIRGEGSYWYPLVKRPGDDQYRQDLELERHQRLPDELEVFPNTFAGTKNQAIRWCEVDAYQRKALVEAQRTALKNALADNLNPEVREIYEQRLEETEERLGHVC